MKIATAKIDSSELYVIQLFTEGNILVFTGDFKPGSLGWWRGWCESAHTFDTDFYNLTDEETLQLIQACHHWSCEEKVEVSGEASWQDKGIHTGKLESIYELFKSFGEN